MKKQAHPAPVFTRKLSKMGNKNKKSLYIKAELTTGGA